MRPWVDSLRYALDVSYWILLNTSIPIYLSWNVRGMPKEFKETRIDQILRMTEYADLIPIYVRRKEEAKKIHDFYSAHHAGAHH